LNYFFAGKVFPTKNKMIFPFLFSLDVGGCTTVLETLSLMLGLQRVQALFFVIEV